MIARKRFPFSIKPLSQGLIMMTTTDSDTFEAEEIVVPWRDVLGDLQNVEMHRVGVDLYAWNALRDGRHVSGTLSPRVDIADDGKSMVLMWFVEVDT